MCSESCSFVLPKWILDEVRKVSYRDYCTGFYFGSPHEKANISFEGGYRREWDVMAVVEHSRGAAQLLHQAVLGGSVDTRYPCQGHGVDNFLFGHKFMVR